MQSLKANVCPRQHRSWCSFDVIKLIDLPRVGSEPKSFFLHCTMYILSMREGITLSSSEQTCKLPLLQHNGKVYGSLAENIYLH